MDSPSPKAHVSNRAGEKCYRNAASLRDCRRRQTTSPDTDVSTKISTFVKRVSHPIA